MTTAPGDLRRVLRQMLRWDPRTATAARVRVARQAEGWLREEIELVRPLIGPDRPAPAMPATLLRPDRPGPHPAVLYCHAHGGDYRLGRRELTEGSRFLTAPGYGPALAQAGFAVLCVDMPGFGDRRGEGAETDLAKALLWHGDSLMGAMLRDLGAALGYLAARPEVDAGRVFTLGLSMGAAHAFFLAALEPGVAGCAHLCMLADMAPLIASGTHARHGFYLTVPGLLAHAEMGDVAGLVAPRPQLACHGGQDPLTPPEARDAALLRLRGAYARTPQALSCALIPDAGHGETAPMRVAVLDFLTRAAAPAQPFHA